MRRVVQRILLGSGAAMVLLSCTEEEERMEPPPPPAARDRDDEEEEAPTVDARVAEMMESLDRMTFAVETRDPFTPMRPERPTSPGGGAAVPVADCDIDVNPLGKTKLEDLQLLGLVTGTALPRAMFLINRLATAVIVTEGALAGPNCSQRIVDIRDNEVVFEEITFDEAARNETVIALNESNNRIRYAYEEPEGAQ